MFDAFRSVRRVLEETWRKQSFGSADSVPITDYAMLQGLVLGLNCRSVVDTRFECGHMAAAIGLAFNRLPPGGAECKYVAVDPKREAAQFMFYFLKRRYPDLARRSFVLVGDCTKMLRTIKAATVDLGIVRSPSADDFQEVLGEMKRIVRPSGLICVYDCVGDPAARDDLALCPDPFSKDAIVITRKGEKAGLTIYQNCNWSRDEVI
ncbi:MAG: hypothetical protein HY000_36045 [Planctomycetes bacterium]|nr:hypothetical protein [Planctomycetota bacterium]